MRLMDPKACLLMAAASLDLDDALEHLADYFEWRRAGGFEPMLGAVRGDQFANDLRSELQRRLG